MIYPPDVFQTLLQLGAVPRRSRGLTRDQISRLLTSVFRSGTGKDTIKSKSYKRCTKDAANLGTTNTEEPPGSTKVDDDDSKSAKGVEAMDAMKECNICMSKYVNNEKLRILICFHEFHIKCINEWIKVQEGRGGKGKKDEGRKGSAGKYASNHTDIFL